MTHINLRKEHLARSAVMLSGISPTTVATLNTKRLALTQDGRVSGQYEQAPVCLACGSAMIVMRTVWPKRKAFGKKKDSKPASSQSRNRVRLFTRSCTVCGRSTRHVVPPAPRKSTASTAAEPAPERELITPSNITETEPKTTNTNAKKRAKTRREGLQALLDKSKQESKASSSLNLMDFMRAS